MYSRERERVTASTARHGPSAFPIALHASCRLAAAAAAALQLRAEYVGVMARVLPGQFKTYLAALEKMEAPVAGWRGARAPAWGAAGGHGQGRGGLRRAHVPVF